MANIIRKAAQGKGNIYTLELNQEEMGMVSYALIRMREKGVNKDAYAALGYELHVLTSVVSKYVP